MKNSIRLGWRWWLILGGCVLASAATAPAPRPPDPLDEIISARRRGEPPGDANAEQEAIQKRLVTTSNAEHTAMTNAYLAQVKASIIDPEHHAGWPCRSWLVYQPTPRRQITPILKLRFERTPDAMLAYAVICPALYAKDEALLNRALAYLEKNDPFLHQRANEQMKSFWMSFIADALKRQTPTSKQANAEKDLIFQLSKP